MAWSVTSFGTNISTSGATVVVTGGTIPAGVLIAVGTDDGSNAASGGSCSDSSLNTYTSVAAKACGSGGTGSHGFAQIFFFNNNAATLSSVTYTKQTTGNNAVIAVLYATGGASSNISDGAVTASAQGSGGTETVTSGTPAVANELFLGWIGWDSSATFTQASGWAAPFNTTGEAGSNANGAGGNQVNSGTGTLTFNPTLSGSPDWAIIVAGFKPVVRVPYQTYFQQMIAQ